MQNIDILSLAKLRVDGRRGNEVRRMQHKLGVVDNADGSAYFEQGLNKLLVCVHGPQEPSKRSDSETGYITCKLVNAPFSGTERKQRRTGDRRSMEVEQIVKETIESVVMLELYSRSEIVIVVHLLETDGSVICAILNAATLALMDAGICMNDMLLSCSAGFIKGQVLQDLSQVEQSSGGANLFVAVTARSEEVIYSQLDSRLSLENFEALLEAATDGCRKIKNTIESGMKEAMKDTLCKTQS